jgi:hypothetical protein
MTTEQQNKFKYDYRMFVIDGLPEEQTVPGSGIIEKEEITKQVITKPTGSKGGSSKPNKPSAAAEKQAKLDNEIALLIKNKTGAVTRGDYTLSLRNGRWSLYDKDGLPKPGTENITSPTELATFIGGSQSNKTKLK